MDKEEGPSISESPEKKRKRNRSSSREESLPDKVDNNEDTENVAIVEIGNENENPPESTINNEENWQASLSSDFRNKIVKKLVDAISGNDEDGAKMNKAVGDREFYAKAIEENMLKIAACKAQYIHFIYEKLEQIKSGSIEKVLKETEELILGKVTPKTATAPKQLKESTHIEKIKNDFQDNGKLMKIRELGNSPICETWMTWLLHSQKCQQDNQNNDPNFCRSLPCKEIINFLKHVDTCAAGKTCTFPKCQFLQAICFAHWLTCDSANCQNCKIIGSHSNRIFKNVSVESNNESTNDESMPSTSGEVPTLRVLNNELMPSTSGIARTYNSDQEASLNNRTNPHGNEGGRLLSLVKERYLRERSRVLTASQQSSQNTGNQENNETQNSSNFGGWYPRPASYLNKRPSLINVAFTQHTLSPNNSYPYNISYELPLPTSTTVNRTTMPSNNASNNNSLPASSNTTAVRPDSSFNNPPPVFRPLINNVVSLQTYDNPLIRPTNSTASQSLANKNERLRSIINSAMIRSIKYHQSLKNSAGNEDEDEDENENEVENENENEGENENENEVENANENEVGESENNSESNEIECIELNDTQ